MPGEGHVLVVGPVSVLAPPEKLRGVRVVLGDLISVVVLDLVVIPGDEPGKGRVRRLQVLVGLVLGVSYPVLPEPVRLGGRLVKAYVAGVGQVRLGVRRRRILVDVVAEVQDEVEILLSHVAVSVVVAVLVHLTRGDREGELRGRGTLSRCRLDPAHGARLPSGSEPVEILPPVVEARQLDVNRMGQLVTRVLGASADDPPEVLVRRQLPAHRHFLFGHPAVTAFRERLGREARPQHHPPVGGRLTGGDAEAERVA
jgi:hypothetical protein